MPTTQVSQGRGQGTEACDQVLAGRGSHARSQGTGRCDLRQEADGDGA